LGHNEVINKFEDWWSIWGFEKVIIFGTDKSGYEMKSFDKACHGTSVLESVYRIFAISETDRAFFPGMISSDFCISLQERAFYLQRAASYLGQKIEVQFFYLLEQQDEEHRRSYRTARNMLTLATQGKCWASSIIIQSHGRHARWSRRASVSTMNLFDNIHLYGRMLRMYVGRILSVSSFFPNSILQLQKNLEDGVQAQHSEEEKKTVSLLHGIDLVSCGAGQIKTKNDSWDADDAVKSQLSTGRRIVQELGNMGYLDTQSHSALHSTRGYHMVGGIEQVP